MPDSAGSDQVDQELTHNVQNPRKLRIDTANSALLLDFDGTLVDFAATPAAVHVDAALRALLQQLHTRLDGALAIITGRSIATLDALLAPLRLPIAGLHGLERRTADGRMLLPPACGDWILNAREALRQQTARYPGLLLEEKSHSLALHWRRAPQHAAHAQRAVRQLHRSLHDAPLLIEGHSVIELRERGGGKDAALDAFMAEPPFRGREPIFIGDDITDLPALRRARERGGVAIHVDANATRYCESLPKETYGLANPRAVRDWLRALLATTNVPAVAQAEQAR